jgi:hypothetical protein
VLLTPVALYAIMPATRSKPGILQRLGYRSAKKLDRVAKAAEIEKTRAIKLVIKHFIFDSEIQRQNYNKKVLNTLLLLLLYLTPIS